jgi:threonine/homoserine/homoserine lactone efflux protein
VVTEFIAVVLITLLAVISPGADFAIVTKNSYLYGRKTGVLTSLGISIGVLIHVFYTLCAISFVLIYTPQFLKVIKYLGAIYLIYIGYKTFMQQPIQTENMNNIGLSYLNAFKYGFFTNVLNPKTTLFVMSTYTQIVSSSTSFPIFVGYGAFMSLAHFIWFSMVSMLFSTVPLREKMLGNQLKINRVIGVFLCLFGLFLFFSN